MLILVLASCASREPREEYNLAFVAIEAAKATQSNKYAPSLWFKAEQAYHEAEEFYKKEDYTEAQKAFIRARSFAERAENASRLKKFETGEGVL